MGRWRPIFRVSISIWPYPSVTNYVAYQAGWFACVLGGASNRPWTGFLLAVTLVAAHFVWSPDRNRDGRRVALAIVVGIAVEAIQIAAGTYRFTSGTVVAALPPPWLLAMWAQMATTFQYSLRPIVSRPIVAASFGAIGGPIAFLAGERLGAVTLARPLTPGLILLSVSWSLAMLIFWAAEKKTSGERSSVRWRASSVGWK